jgi:hypothetical protein
MNCLRHSITRKLPTYWGSSDNLPFCQRAAYSRRFVAGRDRLCPAIFLCGLNRFAFLRLCQPGNDNLDPFDEESLRILLLSNNAQRGMKEAHN